MEQQKDKLNKEPKGLKRRKLLTLLEDGLVKPISSQRGADYVHWYEDSNLIEPFYYVAVPQNRTNKRKCATDDENKSVSHSEVPELSRECQHNLDVMTLHVENRGKKIIEVLVNEIGSTDCDIDTLANELLIRHTEKKFREMLHQGKLVGKYGWWNSITIKTQALQEQYNDHMHKGNFRMAALVLMMIAIRTDDEVIRELDKEMGK